MKPNGFCVIGLALSKAVMAKLLVELSTKVELWQVSRLVFAIAVSGVVGGVNVLV